MKNTNNFTSTFPVMERWSQRSTTAKAAMVGYRTGSAHGHADHAAALAVDTYRTPTLTPVVRVGAYGTLMI